MKTKLLIIVGLMIFGGSLVLPTMSYAFAVCAPTSFGEPMLCFDSFHVSHEPLTEELIMDSIYRNLETNYDGWIQTDRSWVNTDVGYEHPTIICTVFDWNGQTNYRMLQWKDDYRLSSLEDYRNDSMCDKWFPPMSLDATNPSFDCKEAVKNEIPTDWKYNCYNEPMGNPLRDISLSKSDDLERLQFILEHCEKYGPLDYVGELRYLNDTHLIDLNTCQWDARTNSGISLDRTVYPVPFSSEESDSEPTYGLDCEVLHIWNYAIDDCNFRINSINFIFSLLLPVGATIIAVILIVIKYKRRF